MTPSRQSLSSLTASISRNYLKLKRRGRALPRSGEHVMPELEAEAEVFVDRWGIPHVYARNEHDLFFLNGYVQAWDRLWQMDFTRRAACGRLAEVLGPDFLPLDRFTRRLGFRRNADDVLRSTGGESQRVLEAYVAGINACIEMSRSVPIEFEQSGYSPEPWDSADVLALGMLVPFTLTPNWDLEIIRSRLLMHLPPEAVAAAETDFDGDYGSASTPGAQAGTLPGSGEALAEFQRLASMLKGGGGSNAWALAGSRTTSGKPILAGDPHLAPGLPNIWHQIHLSCGDLDVIGASLPGVPGVTIGHNRRLAWSVTAGMVDVADLFENPVDGHVISEKIAVRGVGIHVEEVFVGEDGPDIAPALGIAGTHLCLKTAPSGDLGGLLIGVSRACDWDTFRAALSTWSSPVLNFTYADTAGNIGYQLAGLVPIREDGSRGLLPNRRGSGRWSGYVPFAELPTVYNPDCGYVVSANDRVAPASYPHWLGIDFLDAGRARRIKQLIGAREKHSPVDVSRMQMDVVSLSGAALVKGLAGFEPRSDDSRWALEQLQAWDCRMNRDSLPACVYATFTRELARRIGKRYFGSDVDYWMGRSLHPLSDENSWAFNRAARAIQLLAGRSTDVFVDWGAEVEAAFCASLAVLTTELGSNRDSWRFGRLHHLHLKHSLSSPQSSALFDRGPYEVSGDGGCVNANSLPPDGSFEVSYLPGFRQVADLSNVSESYAVMPGGQSGDPLGKHYNDLTPLWLAGKMHRQYFARTDVVRHSESTLRLLPRSNGA